METSPPVRYDSELDWRFDHEKILLEFIATCARTMRFVFSKDRGKTLRREMIHQ
jgi:hypothetical protein